MKKKQDKNELVTKVYLDYRLHNLEERLGWKINETITSAMDKLYTRIDPILPEVENSRIDREI